MGAPVDSRSAAISQNVSGRASSGTSFSRRSRRQSLGSAYLYRQRAGGSGSSASADVIRAKFQSKKRRVESRTWAKWVRQAFASGEPSSMAAILERVPQWERATLQISVMED